VELPGVREGELRPTREARSLSISAQGELALDGRSLTVDELASALAADPRDDPLQLRADAHLTARVFVPLLDRLREAGVAQIELVTLDAR
jgi:biopolymer transport protein ExbD